MTGVQSNSIVMRSATAVTAEIDGQLVSLDINKGICYGLNPVATRIWELIGTPASADDIVPRLLDEYDIDEATCRAETVALLEELISIGLVHPA